MTRQRVLSGVQTTGHLHLGNYLGAIRNWVEGQSQYDNYFFLADLHAITVPHNPETLAADTYTIAALYLACGLDLQHTAIFVQSHVPAHAEFTWLLSCITPLNWLEDMIQFKEKAVKQGQDVGTGLLTYPVLMAADILLYEPDKVPVGEDQKQHLELTRDLVDRFNYKFATPEQPILKRPAPLIRAEGARVMSLTDGTRKMSKSDPSELSRINLLDPPDVIQNKIKRCKTDPIRGLVFGDPDRPECNNLLTL
ncbi:MAG: tryptophan--tRNA ligase, partial [Phormidesmis sp. CAN_BIN36]|nr:tryptophan--tRNA ligase [Phormidesmis sp. CAN_BIN36]